VASIRIVDVPDGQAPEHIRRAWVGLVLPLPAGHPPGPKAARTRGVLSYGWRKWLPGFRSKGRIDQVFLVAGSAAIDVLKKSDPYAAEWWIKNAPHFLQPGRALAFQAHVCKLLDLG
jgi:hypothetical protein